MRIPRPQGQAATFLRTYLIGGVLILLIGFIAYSQYITRRLEQNNVALAQSLAKLSSFYASVADRETSLLFGEVIQSIASPDHMRFVITNEDNEPILARGIDPTAEDKLDEGLPLTHAERDKVAAVLEAMRRASREPIKTNYIGRDRRIIGKLYYGDVDASELVSLPFALADVNGEPVAWRLYDGWETVESHPDNARRAKGLMKDAERRGRVEELQINPPAQQGMFYYDPPPIRALQWMPVVQGALVVAFLLGGVALYRRMQADEQGAVWTGLAKESAHQLGTPITSLMGWVDLARELNPIPQDGAAMPELYDEMERDLQRLQRIVGRFSQVGLAPTLSVLDVNGVMRDAAGYFRERLPTRSIKTVIDESYDDVPTVMANEDLLQWVLENLIRNALDAIEDAGREAGRIRLASAYDGSRKCVTITVEDNGGGMSRAVKRRIFSPGFSTKKRGWGVGLTLVKRIVETYHRGRIRVARSNEHGTLFEVTLPATESRD